jgi:hypothetical protein
MRAPLIPYVNLPLQANFLAHIPHLIEPPVNFFLLSFFGSFGVTKLRQQKHSKIHLLGNWYVDQ